MLDSVASIQQGRADCQGQVSVHHRDSSTYRSSKFFYSPAHPGSPLSSAMATSGAVQAVFIFISPWYDTVSYLHTHRYAPKKQLAAALLPWAFKLLRLAVTFVLGKKLNPVLQPTEMEG